MTGFFSSVLGVLAHAADTPAPAKPKPRQARALDWMELLPAKERRMQEDPVASLHDYLGEDGPAAKQVGSFATNPTLDGAYVKVPGFAVPMTLAEQGVMGEFLLVPYYGACIHTPPPPPNQIVYVKLQKPVRIKSIWDPYWVTGVLTTAKKDTSVASAAYTLAGERLDPYEF